MAKDLKDYKFLVVGAGTMGSTIAQVFAAAGFKVIMADLKQEFLDGALDRIEGNIQGLYKENMADSSYGDAVKANLSCILNAQIPEYAKDVDVAIEVIFENEDAKKELYKILNDSCSSECIFASNTSGMDVFNVCKDVVENPERFIITHWFNPPHLMKIVEVVKGENTSDETAETMRKLLEIAGRKPAVLNNFVPGFIVNRMATVINRELYYMVEQGWISAEDAENALRYSHGLRFGFEGPIALWDFVGLEIPIKVAKGVLPTLCNNTDTVSLGEKLIAEGKTGVRVGEGMLKYPDAAKYTEKRSRRIIQMTKVVEGFEKEDREE